MSSKILDLLNISPELRSKVSFEQAKRIDLENKKYEITYRSNSFLEPKETIELVFATKKLSQINVSVTDIKCLQPINEIDEAELYWYFSEWIKALGIKISVSDFIVEKQDNVFNIICAKQMVHEKITQLDSKLRHIFINFQILSSNQTLMISYNNSKFDHSSLIKNHDDKQSEISKPTKVSSIKPNSKFDELKNVNKKEEQTSVYFEGQVFKIEERKTKNSKMNYKVFLNNDEKNIIVNIFAENSERMSKVKKGNWYRFYGDYKYDSWNSDYILQSKDNYDELISEEFNDIPSCNSEVKRSELHVHSTMSQMDSIGKVSEYFDVASKYGLKALAFTDHNVAQAFPDIMSASKKYPNVKPIYGVEFDVYNDISFSIVENERDENLLNAEYVVFDIETTGLSAQVHEIIEIGAIKVKGGMIVSKFQKFVKPKKPVSAFTTKLTKITNEMLANKEPISIVIKEFKNWIGDLTVVAHNSSFDMSFIENEYRKNGLGTFKNPVVDTLKISWFVNKTKNHRLGTIARDYGVAYDDSVAHRADYDAEVLNGIYDTMLHKLFKEGIKNLNQINKLKTNSSVIDNIFSNHVTVLAKNENGLKEIFKLVSEANTSYFNKTKEYPVLPLSRILKNRADILIGSSCSKGIIWEAAASASKHLSTMMRNFDYIELFPPEVYSFLVRQEKLSDEEVIQIMKTIAHYAELNEIKVIATSNAHYVLPKHKKGRDIYIANKGLGGRPHPLYNYSNPSQENPNQHLRTTEEMLKIFSKVFGKETAMQYVVENSNNISEQIDVVKPIKEGLFTPKIDGVKEKFEKIISENLEKTYGKNLLKEEFITKRIEREKNSILKHGFEVIYYLSALAVKESNDRGYLVGSRGSVGSSLVATLTGITEVNPLPPHYICKQCKHHEFDNSVDDGYDLPNKKCPLCNSDMYGEGHNIPFETFLGFDGDKVPDIDLNFSSEVQAEVHNFIKEELGEQNVFRAGTITTVAEKTAFGFAKNYLEVTGQTDYNMAFVNYLANLAEGTKRSTGQHPGGLIIVPSDKEIYDFTPINFPAGDYTSDWKTTHFDFHSIHDNLLKLDILGHIDPTVVRHLSRLTQINPKDIPMNDPKVISLFTSSKELNYIQDYTDEPTGALGIPEFGTEIVRKVLQESKPSSFADLIRISGLTHGTDVWKGNARDLIINKNLKLTDVISTRDEIMNYLISKGIENKTAFAIMEDVRKGKKLTQNFKNIMIEHKVPDWYIESCEKIKYMFPKAHATAYVIMAYRIAWFKIYYPLEYYATFFTSRKPTFEIETLMDGVEGIKRFKEAYALRPKELRKDKDVEILNTYDILLEMYSRGIFMQPLSLKKSRSTKWEVDYEKNSLIPPFTILDGLSEVSAKKITDARRRKMFSSFEDFEKRSEINKTILEKIKTLNLPNEFEKTQEVKLQQQSLFEDLE